jgi:nucleotide-binding universal stress UspA family protein
MHTIVVGVDGSEGSQAALRFALDEARLRGAEVKAVSAWHVPALAYEAGWTAAPVDQSEYSRIAEEELAASLRTASGEGSELTVSGLVREGQAAEVLCAEAAGADLLVVGSRGLGGFRGLLLGSVSQQVAAHAPCPVVIIPHGREA